MKIGLISDIHANRPALTAVLCALQGVDQIWCAGDLTGYYPDPNGVISDLLAHRVDCIKGNHDWYLENPPSTANRMLRQSLTTTLSRITPQFKQFIRTLPTTMLRECDGLRILVCHGSPWETLEEYVYPDYPDFEKFSEVDADIIILGHTHYPMLREIRGRKVINPGSCGQPRDKNSAAAYAILDTRDCSISFQRAAYDATELIQSIKALGLDEKLISYLPNITAAAGYTHD